MGKEKVPATAAMPYEQALLEVVKGLHKDPILLFGVAFGIVVVAILSVTTSLAPVLVVAAVFVIVLAARVHQRAQRVRSGLDLGVTVFGASLLRSPVATITAAGHAIRSRVSVLFVRAKDSPIGTVGSTDLPKKTER